MTLHIDLSWYLINRCSDNNEELVELEKFISSSSCPSSSSSSSSSSYLWVVWLALGLTAIAVCAFALFRSLLIKNSVIHASWDVLLV